MDAEAGATPFAPYSRRARQNVALGGDIRANQKEEAWRRKGKENFCALPRKCKVACAGPALKERNRKLHKERLGSSIEKIKRSKGTRDGIEPEDCQ